MAEIIDEPEVTGEFDELPEKAAQQEPQQEVQESTNEPTHEPEDDIPEKYRGKSAKEIIAMHQELERKFGSQGSEVGELRKVVDQFIRSQTAPKQAEKQEPEEEIDFFSDPEKAVSRAIEKNPYVQQALGYAQQAQVSSALNNLQKKHPDMQEVVNNPKFAEWIKGSKVRTELFVKADQQYDVDAADELFSTWKQINQMNQSVVQAEQQARKQSVTKANTGSARGSSETKGKPVYRRLDIIKLMQTDPARYEALQPEIMQAYKEGRVK